MHLCILITQISYVGLTISRCWQSYYPLKPHHPKHLSHNITAYHPQSFAMPCARVILPHSASVCTANIRFNHPLTCCLTRRSACCAASLGDLHITHACTASLGDLRQILTMCCLTRRSAHHMHVLPHSAICTSKLATCTASLGVCAVHDWVSVNKSGRPALPHSAICAVDTHTKSNVTEMKKKRRERKQKYLMSKLLRKKEKYTQYTREVKVIK